MTSRFWAAGKSALWPGFPSGAVSPYAADALALDYKNGAYWSGGTQYAETALPGRTYTRSGAKGERNALTSGDMIDDFAANVPGIVPGVGYWSRGAITNTCLQSQNLTDAAWNQNLSVTVTSNVGTAPDGTMTADRVELIAGATNTSRLGQGCAAVSSVTRTAGAFVKSNTGSNQTFKLKNTETGVLDYFSPDLIATLNWQWFSFTQAHSSALSAINFGVTTGSAGSAADLLVWQAQVVGGADGGPIIVTGAAAASTGADAYAVSLANGTYNNTVYTYADDTTETIPTTVAAGVFTVANPKAKAIALITVNP